MLRGGDAEEDVGFEDGAGEVGGDVDVYGQGETREIGQVFAGFAELIGEGGGVGPQEELMSSATGEREGEGGAPGTSPRTAIRLMLPPFSCRSGSRCL